VRITVTLGALSALWLAASGGRSAPQIIRPAGPVWCPTTTRPSNAKQNRPNAPGEQSFDTRSLLGLTEEQASATVSRHGCILRVIERDGRKFALRADFRGSRVNVGITRGIVTSVGVY
jgi:hypothetical protein